MKVVFVVPQNNFRDEELFVPKKFLESEGVNCFIASKEKGTLKGMLGAKVCSDFSLKDVGNDFDAVIFVGGGGAEQYFSDAHALGLARKYFEMGCVVGAICIAPSILANAGILKDVKATSFSSEEKNLVKQGAIFSKKPVEVHGLIVTAAGPMHAKEFGEKIFELISRKKK